MSADFSDCPAATWLGMMFLSLAGFLVLLVLLLTVAALARYVLTGRGFSVGRVELRTDPEERRP